jgi:predicted DNA-binding transcriptional regulator AlpA
MGKLMTDKEVAERLAVNTTTVRKWRMFGTGPRFIRIGKGSIRYDPGDLEKYLATRAAGGEQPGRAA